MSPYFSQRIAYQQSIGYLDPLKAPLKVWLNDLLGLLYPRRCASCDEALYLHERILCQHCHGDLPLTRFHDDPENRVEKLFQGRLPLHAASSFLLFNRTGMVQRMLHRLKYKGETDLGLELGRMMAEDLAKSERFSEVDLLVALPLHPKREYQRGYNQSRLLVEGMRSINHLEDASDGVVRTRTTRTQTRRGRWDRWTNVREAFQVKRPDLLEGRHILLVDDVVTTGATLEACARSLLDIPGVKLSIFTAACA